MKLTCTQSDLNSKLSLVSRAVPSRPTHPILGNVLLVADSKQQTVSLTGFDLYLGIKTSFPAQVSEGDRLTVPAKLLNDIVSKLPADAEITLSCTSDEGERANNNYTIEITTASGRFQLRGMGPEEFPELPQVEDGKALMLPKEAVLQGLSGSLFAASTDETKQVLTGVHLNHQQDSLEFAATDGHRLAVVETTDPEEETEGDRKISLSKIEDFAVTIPARALREVERTLNASPGTELVALQFDEGQVVFQIGSEYLTSRKLEGAYPIYQQLIPQQFSRGVTVDRRQLINSLELVAVLADQKNNVVKFAIGEEQQQLDLSVETQDVGNGTQSIPAQVTGSSLDIAFNVKYLMDGLKALPGSEVKISLNGNNQPVVCTPVGSLKMTYLVMPVQLRS